MQDMNLLDANCFCPGGRDKKIKYCCSDIQKELEQIDRMFKGKQYAACLSFLETLVEKHPDRACLRFIQSVVLREMGQYEKALAIVISWHEREPDNIRPRTELVRIYTLNGDFEKAIHSLIDTIERFELGSMMAETVEVAFVLAMTMIPARIVIPALPILRFLQSFPDSEIQQQAFGLYQQALSEDQNRILYKLFLPGADIPEDFPEKEKYQAAISFAYSGHWKKALAQMLDLESKADQFGQIYRDIAFLYFWLADIRKGTPYLEKYVHAPDTSEENAVEMLVVQWFMENRFWEDEVPYIQRVSWSIKESNTVLEQLLSNNRVVVLNVDSAKFKSENSPPPQKVFCLLDKPYHPDQSTKDQGELPPRLTTIFALFGKQTDRDARIEAMMIPVADLDIIEKFFRDLFNDNFGDRLIENEENISWTERNILPDFYQDAIQPSLSKERLAMEQSYLENIFIPQWIDNPLGLLNGKSPRDAAKDPSLRIPLLAAIERFCDYFQDEEVFDRFQQKLRSQLDLPQQEAIVFPADAESKDLLNRIDHIPVWRWRRIDFNSLPTSILCSILDTACVFGQDYASARIADVIVNRNDPLSVPVRNVCYQLLISDSIRKGDFQKAHEFLDLIYLETKKADLSDGLWNLLEIRIAIAEKKPDIVKNMIQHIVTHHRNELDVMEGLQRLMSQLGFFPGMGNSAKSPFADPNPPVEQNQKPVSGLWTPDRPEQSGDSTSESKLWTPD